MAGEVVVDALPYIDQGYDEPGVREAALAMVDEETRRYRPTKNYLEHLPQLNLGGFETEIMKTEFERMQQRQPMDLLSMKRYELPPPPAGKMTDIAAWTECVENSMAQLEHQATRICNLELMLDYGCEAWKSYLETLIQLVLQAQKQLQTVRKQIQETNWQRKNEQLLAGERLRQLEATWVGLVSKNYEIEQACAILEKEAMRMNHQVALRGPRREKIREPEISRSPIKSPVRQPVQETIPEVAVPRTEIVQEPIREEPVKEVIQETVTVMETSVEVREVVQETVEETVQVQQMDEEPQVVQESVQETEQVKAIPEKMEVEQDDESDDKSDEESSSSEEESSDDTDSEEEDEEEEEEDDDDKDDDEDSDDDDD